MRRCCDGSTRVQANGVDGDSWVVMCAVDDTVLAVVDGPRDEVYADL